MEVMTGTERKIIPLSPMQIEDLAKFIANPRFGNFSDPGTRKTAVFNVQCQYIWKYEKKRILFLMPTSLANQNRLSFFKFTDFEEDDIVLVRGTPKQRQKAMETDAKVFIGSFNFFVAGKDGKSDYEKLKALHPDLDCLGVDEFHMGFGNIESVRTQCMLYWMSDKKMQCKWFVPITGTPINGRLGSFYPIIYLIEPRYYYNHKTFMAEHAIYDMWGRVAAWKNTKKVKELLNRHSVRHTFEEVHGKESIIIEPQPIIMADKQRKFYERYEETETLVNSVGDIKAAKHEAEAIMRMRQICNCPVSIGQDFDLAKDEMMEVHFKNALEAEKAIVVYAASHEEQERLLDMAKKCGFQAGLINGNVPVKIRDQIDTAFKARQLNCVIASPATVAVGYDWEFVDYMVFYSMDYMDSSFVQGYRRAIRGARHTPLLCYILYYEDSVEEDILTIVEGKMKLAAKTDETKTIFELRKRKRQAKGKLGKLQEAMERYTEKAKSKLAHGE